MAKDNSDDGGGSGTGGSDGPNNNNLSTPSTSGSKRAAHRSRPYDANNSFVKKVTTKMTDLIPQRSWISKWFNNSQDQSGLSSVVQNREYEIYDDKQLQPPPLKRPCIRMDVIHPPGTFAITPRNRNMVSETQASKDHFSNHNEMTQDFLEPTASGSRLPRFISSTPAFPMNTGTKVPDTRSTLNMLISEQNNGAGNGIDDNSESSESTSGCSSLIPQNNRQEAPPNTNYNSPFGNKRRFINDKLSFTNHLQSPRSLFLDTSSRDTLSNRQPSFNALMVNNTLDRSASLASPFYSGNTMFGGANAANLYRSNSVLTEASRYQKSAPKRASVQVNPSNDTSSDHSGMSHTAKRILEALEQYSSPLSDAKKIPIRNIMGGSNQNSPITNRKRAREEDTNTPRVGLRHLTRELVIPTVPDLLRIRRQQKLQNTTVNARKIMSARSTSSTVPTQEYHIRTQTDKEPMRSAPLKAKKKSCLEEEETVEAVNLPMIPLPISSLPRFDISLPQCTKPATPERSKLDTNESFKFASPIKLPEATKCMESINNFTFSKPITPSKMTSLSPSNESYEMSKTLSVDSNETLSSTSSFPNFIWAGPTQTLKLKEKEEPKGPKVASELKSGSVMDFFTKKSISNNLSNVWECSECLIKNNEKETHCIACKTAKPDDSNDIEILECPSQDSKPNKQSLDNNKFENSKTKPLNNLVSSSNSFGKSSSIAHVSTTETNMFNSTTVNVNNTASKVTEPVNALNNYSTISENKTLPFKAFKPVKSSWECPCCMVRNVDTVTTCPCCNTAKPCTINTSPKRTIEKKSLITTAAPTTVTTQGFGDKFKNPEGSWSCDTCMIQNKSEVNKCVACETPRAGAVKVPNTTGSGFGDLFKKPEGSWTCDSCMLSNKAEVTKCVACETDKPGSAAASKSSKLQFKVDMPANATTFKFGVDKAGEPQKTATELPKTNGFTFGSGASTNTITGGFSFGVPNSVTDKKKESEDGKVSGFSFKPNENISATATFQFGAKSTETKDKIEDKQTTSTATLSFGASNKSEIKSSGFVFGSPTTSNKEDKDKNESKTSQPTFSFGSSSATATPTSKDLTNEKESKAPSTDKITTTPVATSLPTSNFVFGLPKPLPDSVSKEAPKTEIVSQAIPKTEVATPSAIPSFNSSVETPKPTAPTFSFGARTTTPSTDGSPKSSNSLFTFGAQPKSTNTTPLPTFGSVESPKPMFFGKTTEITPGILSASSPQPEKAPVMTFGSAATTNPTTFSSQTNQTTPSLFGNASPSVNTNESKPPMFCPPETKSTSAFGEPESKLPAFSTSTTSKASVGSFAAPSATPAFGAAAVPTNVASPFGAATNVFGNGAPSSFSATSTPSLFSTTKPNETTPTPTPGIFTFGQSSGFNFSTGSNASASSDQKSLFTFGASSNTTQVGNGFGGFGATPAAASSTPSPAFTFNPPKPTSMNFITIPTFNAPNTATQPAAPPPAYPGTTSGGFNFGNTGIPNNFNFGNATATSGNTFSFNAPTPQATPPAFDPNAPPTYNFTAGSGASFTHGKAPPRKIKKAVRRMPRQ